MNPHRTGVVAAVAFILVLFPTGAARAQEKVKPAVGHSPDVHRMEIWNGPVRSVHYVYTGDSSGEASSLRELDRAENEVAVAGARADQMQELHNLYLKNERLLAQRRGQVEALLYGYSSAYTVGLPPGTAEAAYGGAGAAAYGFGGFNGPSPYSYSTLLPARGIASSSLPAGGSEGALNKTLAGGIAALATPKAAADADHAYDAALVRLSAYPGVFVAALTPRTTAVAQPQVDLQLKEGGKVKGTLVFEGPETLFVREDGQQRLTAVAKKDLKPAAK